MSFTGIFTLSSVSPCSYTMVSVVLENKKKITTSYSLTARKKLFDSYFLCHGK